MRRPNGQPSQPDSKVICCRVSMEEYDAFLARALRNDRNINGELRRLIRQTLDGEQERRAA